MWKKIEILSLNLELNIEIAIYNTFWSWNERIINTYLELDQGKCKHSFSSNYNSFNELLNLGIILNALKKTYFTKINIWKIS